jgi:hypothetical protein
MLGLWSRGSAPIGLSLHVAFRATLDDVLRACDRLRQLAVTPLSFYTNHYNGHRPHRALQLVPPDGGDAIPVNHTRGALAVRRLDLLGGLIHEYRQAA